MMTLYPRIRVLILHQNVAPIHYCTLLLHNKIIVFYSRIHILMSILPDLDVDLYAIVTHN